MKKTFDYYCPCGKLICKVIEGEVQIKCRRCGEIQTIAVSSLYKEKSKQTKVKPKKV